jgi:hypothetical protein
VIPSAVIDANLSLAEITVNQTISAIVLDLVQAVNLSMDDVVVPFPRNPTSEIGRPETEGVQFELKVIGEKRLDALIALKLQLHNPQSLFIQQNTTAMQITSFAILLQCPVGTIRSIGDAVCFQCTDHKYTPDGTTCFSCPAGTGPTANRGECELCPGTTFSLSGICQKCLPGTMGSEDRTRCIDISNSDGTKDVKVAMQILSDTNVLPSVAIDIKFDSTAIEDESMRAKSVQMMIEDMSISLGVNISDVVVADISMRARRMQTVSKNLAQRWSHDQIRRRVQTYTTSQVAFVFDVPNRGATVSQLLMQLEDPSSPLRKNFRAATINAEVPPTFKFVCPVHMHRPDSFPDCLPCDGDSVPNPDDHFKSCKNCAERESPDPFTDFATCGCAKGNYDTSLRLKCHSVDFTSTKDTFMKCEPCSNLECIEDCHNQLLTVAAGWSLEAKADGSADVFKCKYKDSCPGGTVLKNSTGCSTGYSSLLCASCSPDYGVHSDGECSDCKEVSWAGVLLLIVCVVIMIILALKVRVWYNYFTILRDSIELIRGLELKAISKILLTTLQLISGFTRVLNITMPNVFAGVLDFLSVFNFDISIGLGCITQMTYVPAVFTNFGMVGLVVALVACVYLYQMHKIDRSDAEVSEDERVEQARAMFDKFDLDGDGIELHELALIVNKIDPAVTSSEIENLFKNADVDDGPHGPSTCSQPLPSC